jgi:DNA-binding NarL/FixJ family response regulator
VETTVLVVDDDAGFRSVALRILTASGFRVIGEADTYAAGMAAALDLQPEAVLVDARLPDGDGIALSLVLRELPWRPRVLLTSSDADVAGQAAAADRADALAFVPKADLPNAPLSALLNGDGPG